MLFTPNSYHSGSYLIWFNVRAINFFCFCAILFIVSDLFGGLIMRFKHNFLICSLANNIKLMVCVHRTIALIVDIVTLTCVCCRVGML